MANKDRIELVTDIGRVVIPSSLYEAYLCQYGSRKEVINHFNRKNKVDRYTSFEHESLASSFTPFFRHPFMGGYSLNEEAILAAKAKRKTEVLEARNRLSSIGLILLVNKPDFEIAMGTTFWDSERMVQELDQTIARAVFGEDYKKVPLTSQAPENLAEIEYVRLNLIPTQYDASLVAIPKPASLDYISRGEVVKSTKESGLLKRLEIKKRDVNPYGMLGDRKTEHYIGVTTRDGTHYLREIPEAPSWYKDYHRRVFSA